MQLQKRPQIRSSYSYEVGPLSLGRLCQGRHSPLRHQACKLAIFWGAELVRFQTPPWFNSSYVVSEPGTSPIIWEEFNYSAYKRRQQFPHFLKLIHSYNFHFSIWNIHGEEPGRTEIRIWMRKFTGVEADSECKRSWKGRLCDVYICQHVDLTFLFESRSLIATPKHTHTHQTTLPAKPCLAPSVMGVNGRKAGDRGLRLLSVWRQLPATGTGLGKRWAKESFPGPGPTKASQS